MIYGLNKNSRLVPEPPSVAGVSRPLLTKHTCQRMPGRKKRCYQCSVDGNKTARGRTSETVHGCLFCKVHLHEGLCYGKFHDNML